MAFTEEFKQAIREFIADKGCPVHFEEGWDGEPQVNFYSWRDWRAEDHCLPKSRYGGGDCRWEVPEGSFLYEETYDQFAGTFADDCDHEKGINVRGCRCACGKYTDVTLRWTGTLAELINTMAPKTEEEMGWTL